MLLFCCANNAFYQALFKRERATQLWELNNTCGIWLHGGRLNYHTWGGGGGGADKFRGLNFKKGASIVTKTTQSVTIPTTIL